MPRAALVLSGGGLLGVGWELGVLRRLQHGGVELGRFERVIGPRRARCRVLFSRRGRRSSPVAASAERDQQLASILAQMNPESFGPVFAVLRAGGEADQSPHPLIWLAR